MAPQSKRQAGGLGIARAIPTVHPNGDVQADCRQRSWHRIRLIAHAVIVATRVMHRMTKAAESFQAWMRKPQRDYGREVALTMNAMP